MTPLEITLLILVLTIVAFITGKIPFSVISAGIMLSLIMTGVMEPAEAFNGFINTNVVMFVAMFVIGAGLTKTSLIDKAEQLVVRYKDNPKMLIFLACIASSLLASITSATATACANIATSMTFLGQGASNITWIDIMAKAGAPNELYIWDFTIARIPLLVVSILYMTFVGYKLMPDIDNNTFVDGGHTGRKSAKLSPIKEKIAIIIIVVTILAMLFESVIGIPMYIVACIGAVLLVLSGILNEKEALDSIHQPTIFLFAGVLTLSEAIKITGAGDVVADWMISLIGNTTNPYLIMAVFFLIPFLLTQIMSNLATLTIFIPLVVSACMKIGIDPRAAVDVPFLLRDRRTKRKAGKLILIEKSASFLCFQRFLFTNREKLDTLYIKLRAV